MRKWMDVWGKGPRIKSGAGWMDERATEKVVHPPWRARVLTLLAALVLSLLLAACDGVEVFPFRETDNYYSVYGYLDTFADSQFVRVVPLRTRLERAQSPTDAPFASIDARVTSFDLTSGDSLVWTWALVRFDDGTYGHLFGARLSPLFPGRTYRLEVRRSDGKTTRAETTVPLKPRWHLGPPQQHEGGLGQTVRLEGVPNRPDDIGVTYTVGPPGSIRPPRVRIPYGRSGRLQDGAWTLDVLLSRDAEAVRDSLAQRLGPDFAFGPLVLFAVTMTTATLDAAWDPPGGVFDPALLMLPGTFSNVQNGFGFFGSIGRFSEEWRLDPATIEALGFLPP